tara:strand:- start:98 stop:268 length:171 start_codon:yes stop_codon:yes gene_type:complete
MLNQTEYIYGVHCGDSNCYSCATQRHNCEELTLLDNKTDMEIEEHDAVSQYESGSI